MAGPKTRNGGQWTEARYRSFVKGALRQATMKWGPIQSVKRKANVRRGFYLCDMCKQEVPATTPAPDNETPTNRRKRSRVKNVHVDHNPPVIDPEVGWTNWDDLIERLFCEEDHLRVLCSSCHKKVTDEEKKLAKERRDREKECGD